MAAALLVSWRGGRRLLLPDAQAHAPVRPPRRRGGQARALRGVGDARAVRRDPRGARRRARRLRRLRRLAHGRDRDQRAAGPEAAAAPALQRPREARRGRRAVLRALPRGRRRARRPLHLPHGARSLPDRHQRRQPRQGPRVVPGQGRRLRRRRQRRPRPLRDARRPGPAGARDRPGDGRRPAARALHHRDAPAVRPQRPGVRDRLHGRGRGRDPLRPRRRGGIVGRAHPPRARRPPAWPRATPCASRSAFTSTATT